MTYPTVTWHEPITPANQFASVHRGSMFALVLYPSGTLKIIMYSTAVLEPTGQAERGRLQTEKTKAIAGLAFMVEHYAEHGLLWGNRGGRADRRPIVSLSWLTPDQAAYTCRMYGISGADTRKR